MGANYVELKLKGSHQQVRKLFESAQDDDRYENGHCYSGGIGMARGLKFVSKSFTDEREAAEWIMDHAQKWEEALAVRIGEGGQWSTDDEKQVYLIGAWCSS